MHYIHELSGFPRYRARVSKRIDVLQEGIVASLADVTAHQGFPAEFRRALLRLAVFSGDDHVFVLVHGEGDSLLPHPCADEFARSPLLFLFHHCVWALCDSLRGCDQRERALASQFAFTRTQTRYLCQRGLGFLLQWLFLPTLTTLVFLGQIPCQRGIEDNLFPHLGDDGRLKHIVLF